MKRREVFAALTAAVLCAVGAMPVGAQGTASEAICSIVDGSTAGGSVYVVESVEASSLTLLGAGTYSMRESIPEDALQSRSFMLGRKYAPDTVEPGDVLYSEQPVLLHETLPPEIEPLDAQGFLNAGTFEQVFTMQELTLTQLDEADSQLVFSDEGGQTYRYYAYTWSRYADTVPGSVWKCLTCDGAVAMAAMPVDEIAAQPVPAGDPDEDGAVNAKDASAVLRTAAQIGAKNKPTLNLAQRNACDVNGDGVVNANDASDILRYAAYIGARNPYRSIQDFLAK